MITAMFRRELAEDLGLPHVLDGYHGDHIIAEALHARAANAGAAGPALNRLAIGLSDWTPLHTLLRHASSGTVPIRPQSCLPSITSYELPPVVAQHWSTSERPRKWARELDAMLGIGDDKPTLSAEGALKERHRVEWVRATQALRDSPTQEALSEAKQALAELEKRQADEAEQLAREIRAASRERSGRMNIAMLTRVFLLRAAFFNDGVSALARAASAMLYQRTLVGVMQCWREDEALRIIAGAIPMSGAAVGVAHELALRWWRNYERERSTIRVHTDGLKRRARAGFVFGKQPIDVEVLPHEKAIIAADNGLITDPDPKRHERELAERDKRHVAQLADRDKRIAELEAQLAASQKSRKEKPERPAQ